MLEKQSTAPDLWDDPEKARRTMRALSDLRDESETWRLIKQSSKDAIELAQMGDESLRAGLEAEVDAIEKTTKRLDFEAILAGDHDHGNAILSIHAGAGGVDAQDFAGMILRMYLRWAEQQGHATEIVDQSDGEEAGIKSVTVAVTGRCAYGYLRAERGVHRLVRHSPFDSAHRRHTSFVLVEPLPEIADLSEIDINSKDLQTDTFRAQGAGGQHMQKNDTAVRITHVPSGIVVQCQNERSQAQNRENAMKVLRARLYELQREEREKEIAALRGDHIKAEWGSQIRSYVIHPYQMVKDHRSQCEIGNVQAVLDGRLNMLMEAYLRGEK